MQRPRSASEPAPSPRPDAVVGPGPARDPYVKFRRIVLAIFALGVAGTFAELILLEHTESLWQLVPVVALPLGLLLAVAAAVRPARITLRLFQSMMALFVIAGGIGLYLHYRGNVEFELEMMPSLRGLKLFWESITGATPALAPGAMAQFGLLGLAYTYRHPALRG